MVNSAGTKLYSHTTSFSVINCGNRGDIEGSGYNGGVIGQINNTLSYAGITSKDIADTTINELIVKYCFNAGGVGGTGARGGIIGMIYNYIGTTNPVRGGKANFAISNNINIGDVSTSTGNSVGGIISAWYDYVYNENCYYDSLTSNNLNLGFVGSGDYVHATSGIIALMDFTNPNVNLTNINVAITGNINYSTALTGGNASYRGGVVGWFRTGNFSRVTLSNNYSAYKRKTNEGGDIDSNVHGSNPATNGANVGEKN